MKDIIKKFSSKILFQIKLTKTRKKLNKLFDDCGFGTENIDLRTALISEIAEDCMSF